MYIINIILHILYVCTYVRTYVSATLFGHARRAGPKGLPGGQALWPAGVGVSEGPASVPKSVGSARRAARRPPPARSGPKGRSASRPASGR